MSLAMAQIAWRRADQLGNFMRVLKLRAIHLDHRPGIPKEDLRGRFHDARLSRPGRPQKQQVPHRTTRRVQSGTENLKTCQQGTAHPLLALRSLLATTRE